MAKFDTLVATAAPMNQRDVNTDAVIPGRFLRRKREEGFGTCLFHDLRFHEDGSENDEFVLNQPAFRGAQILVADENFGCGSSRESAVFALHDYGFRCVIAPSFGDIFHNNCFKNGLLPIVLPAEQVATLRAQAGTMQGAPFTIDLAAQTVTGVDGVAHRFEIDPFRKRLLLQGVDEIDLTLSFEDKIAAFEAAR
ncbi:3-isopropylmalate dehydratase small subunit [Rhodovarius crocodyli]|uniref:3-isopropylmalate dehydratase small subunit n=1 Tax=Rhodovarius crocodyli TaxID=1979269 RepID=A0A437M2E1_9PROT|nr:3-isopropylmalate dehydratase small subunit [Rhodovarius crocodyli]RVT91782.1 3-isopropylmalate dehydratase small subunit [Rhodovarius crocodyli]